MPPPPATSIAAFLAVILLFSCKGYDSYEYLNGEFIGSTGQNPATLISPVDEGTVVITKQFSWSKQDGAKSYKIEFSLSTDFSAPVLRATVTTTNYIIRSGDLVGVSSLPLKTFYWRVTTTYATKAEISATLKFNLMDPNIVYVDGNSTATGQVGNQAIPYKVIQDAIDFAATSGRGKVYVAGGTSSTPIFYPEAITMREGVSLYGGYNATDWTRNGFSPSWSSSYIIAYDTSITVFIPNGITSNTVLDGFMIYNSNRSADTIAIFITKASPVITNNLISGRFADTENFGIYIADGAPLIYNNIIMGGNGTGTNYAIYTTNLGAPRILNNTIFGGSVGPSSYGIYLGGVNTSEIKNNIIFTLVSGICIFEAGTGSPSSVRNNNFSGCATYYQDTTTGTITNLTTNITTGEGSNTLANFGNTNVVHTSLLMDDDGLDGKPDFPLDNDWHLNAALPGNCNVRAGGLNLSTVFSTDLDGLTRSAVIPSPGPPSCTPTNAGAAGWSMGAYESN